MKTILAATATSLFLLASPSFADCSADVTKISDAMATLKLDETVTAKAKELMDKATAAGAAKDEAACLAATTELSALVGLTK